MWRIDFYSGLPHIVWFPGFQSLVHNLTLQYSMLLLQETGQCTTEHLLKTATSGRLCWSEATLYQQTNTMHYHTWPQLIDCLIVGWRFSKHSGRWYTCCVGLTYNIFKNHLISMSAGDVEIKFCIWTISKHVQNLGYVWNMRNYSKPPCGSIKPSSECSLDTRYLQYMIP